MFGVAWITERHLVTGDAPSAAASDAQPKFRVQCVLTGHASHAGSRDRTVRLWCVGEESGRPNTEPMVTQHEKARTMSSCIFATCSAADLQLIMRQWSRCYFVELCCSSPLHLRVRRASLCTAC